MLGTPSIASDTMYDAQASCNGLGIHSTINPGTVMVFPVEAFDKVYACVRWIRWVSLDVASRRSGNLRSQASYWSAEVLGKTRWLP